MAGGFRPAWPGLATVRMTSLRSAAASDGARSLRLRRRDRGRQTAQDRCSARPSTLRVGPGRHAGCRRRGCGARPPAASTGQTRQASNRTGRSARVPRGVWLVGACTFIAIHLRPPRRSRRHSRSSRSSAASDLFAGLDHPAARQHVHRVGHDVVEQSLVVGDHHHRAVRRTQRVHTVGHDAQRAKSMSRGRNRSRRARKSFGSRSFICRIPRRASLLAAGKADIERGSLSTPPPPLAMSIAERIGCRPDGLDMNSGIFSSTSPRALALGIHGDLQEFPPWWQHREFPSGTGRPGRCPPAARSAGFSHSRGSDSPLYRISPSVTS